MLASYFCGVFLLAKKCDWRPTRVQEYLGILCDSGTATLRVPQEKLDVVHTLLTEACLLYTSPSPRDATLSRMPSSA